MSLRFPLLLLLTWALPAGAESRDQAFAGPVQATVLKVRDGDTFLAEAEVWPGQYLRINVRIRGIDAPEMKARCDGERDAAQAAREELRALLGEGRIALSNIGGAKYYGRVLADVATEDGVAVGDAMLRTGRVRAYGGGRRDSWCAVE